MKCPYNLIGNKDTLDTIPKSKGINTRDELLKFHSKYYSSNIMSLAVLGKGEWRILLLYRLYWGKQFQYINHIWMMNHAFWHLFSTAVHMIWGILLQFVCVLSSESLDELSEMVAPLFSPVENKSVDIPFWSEGPYGPEHVKVSLQMMSSTNIYIHLIIHSLVLVMR